MQLHVLTQGLGVEAGVEEHRPGEFGHIAGEDVGGLTAQDAPALGRQVDEQTRFEAVVVDAHVRAFEDLLTRPAEDDRALPEVGQGLGACSQQEVGDGDAVGAIGRDVGGEARLGAVDAHPHLRR